MRIEKHPPAGRMTSSSRAVPGVCVPYIISTNNIKKNSTGNRRWTGWEQSYQFECSFSPIFSSIYTDQRWQEKSSEILINCLHCEVALSKVINYQLLQSSSSMADGAYTTPAKWECVLTVCMDKIQTMAWMLMWSCSVEPIIKIMHVYCMKHSNEPRFKYGTLYQIYRCFLFTLQNIVNQNTRSFLIPF